MLMRDVAHETRNGGEAFAGAFAAPVMTVAERRESRHRRWRSRVGHNGSSHARLNCSDACTRKGVSVHEVNCRRGKRNRRGSRRWRFPTLRGSTQGSKRRRRDRGCKDLRGGPKRLLVVGEPLAMNVSTRRCGCEQECIKL